MTPSLYPPSGINYARAVLLLSPLFASLTKEEFSAVITLIRNSSAQALVDTYEGATKVNCAAITAGLMTRFSGQAGMSQISDNIWASAIYMDRNEIMPPDAMMYTNSILEEYFPGISDFVDNAGDIFQKVAVVTDPSLSPLAPPSLLEDGENANPNYVRGVYKVYESSFKFIDENLSAPSAE